MRKYDELNEYFNSFEKRAVDAEQLINSGNYVVDAILNVKFLNAKTNLGIETNITVKIPPVLNIEDYDLCVLLGNLIDNSIEACQRISLVNIMKFIKIELSVIKDNLLIEIMNTYTNEIEPDGQIFKSSKTGPYHGIGISQINNIVEKYDGYISRKYDAQYFQTTIMFCLS